MSVDLGQCKNVHFIVNSSGLTNCYIKQKGEDVMTNKSSKVPVKSEESHSERGWGSLANLRGEVDHLFEEFQEGWPFGKSRHRRKAHTFGDPFAFSMRMPAVDVVDKEKYIQLKAELPGMDESDIEVQLTDRMLTISGEKKEEHEEGEKEGSYYLSERRYGSFKRSLSIPEGVNPDKVEASFSKGVLTVTLQKTPEARKKPKKIEVKSKG